MTYLLLCLGFALLIQGANWLVSGATAIAARFGISDLLVGLTIVSIGTSLPELMVSVIASVNGNSDLAVGNVLGSNIANILLILGLTAMVCDLPIQRNTLLSELPFSLAAALLIGFLANASLGFESENGLEISRIDGMIVLFFFFLFMVYIYLVAKESKKSNMQAEASKTSSWSGPLLPIVAGVVALFSGGKWVVDGASHIAQQIGMSETFIGLTVVALGTSLPELVTSITAALKKNTDIAVGNAIGSNIFNLLWILGISALIRPIPFNIASNIDILVVIASTCMIFLALIFGGRLRIKRVEGIFFLLAYLLYIVFVVKRG